MRPNGLLFTFANLMILVTGASGFVGQYLVRALSARGEAVRALYHNNMPKPAELALPGIEWKKADLLDIYDVEEVMQGVTHIYHCAAIVSFQQKLQEKMLHFNPESTANIVNQALTQGIKKMVYLSSVAAIGRPESSNKEITEAEEWGESKYNSAYGISKYMAEMEVWRGIGEGLGAVIVNPGIILGAGDWGKGSAGLMKVAWNQFPFYTNGVTGWVDVEDVVTVLVQLMQADVEAERYILCSGNYSFRNIFTLMAGALQRKPPFMYASPFVTGLVWRYGKLQNMLGIDAVITRETARNAHSISLYNNQKIHTILPEFDYTPIEVTIKKMAKVFLENYKK